MVRALSTDTSGREHGLPAGDHLDRNADEANYRALVENLPAVIYQVAPDDDRRTKYVSPHVETALGYSREEWLDQPDIWMELLHPEDREPTLAAHDLHNETGRPWSREYRLIASDGQVVWFRDVANLRIESIWGNIYVGGSWVADRNMAIHFDNMVVARNRIGGGGAPPSSEVPSAPQNLRIISSGTE